MSEQSPNPCPGRIDDVNLAEDMAYQMNSARRNIFSISEEREYYKENERLRWAARSLSQAIRGCWNIPPYQEKYVAGAALYRTYPKSRYPRSEQGLERALKRTKRDLENRHKDLRIRIYQAGEETGNNYYANVMRQRENIAEHIARCLELSRDDEPKTRIDDEDLAHVMAYAAEPQASWAADHRFKNTDDSWAQGLANRKAEEVGVLYDRIYKNPLDISQLTKADEPKTRIDDTDKAEAMAHSMLHNMAIASGYYPYGAPSERDEYKHSTSASIIADKLDHLASAKSDAIIAGYFYDLEHSQASGRINDVKKAELMAYGAKYSMDKAFESEKEIVTKENYIKHFEGFRDGNIQQPPLGYGAYSKDRMDELIETFREYQAKCAEKAKYWRNQAERDANITGGEYDIHGPEIASGGPKIIDIEKDGTIRRTDPRSLRQFNKQK